MKKRYGRIVRYYAALSVCVAAALTLCGIFTAFFTADIYVGAVECSAGIIALVTASVLGKMRKVQMTDFLHSVRSDSGAAATDIVSSFPAPMLMAHIDGTIGWYNELFSELFTDKNLFGATVESIFPELKWGEILKKGAEIEANIRINEKFYTIIGRLVKEKTSVSDSDEDKYSVYMYLFDKTDETEFRTLYQSERADVAVISIDNYDEVLQRVTDIEEQSVNSQIRTIINEWGAEGHAMVKKTDRDRYFLVFEHKYLEKYIENKFDILDKVRAVGEQIKMPLSVSIGIGTSEGVLENENSARNALDMALGRGGDQVSVKDDTQYKFYGSKARDYERSTRVKTRAFALALKDFINGSDKVIFMGHSGADYDCFGAAMGLQRAVRTMNKTPYILYDNNSPAIRELYDELRNVPEYKGMFISAEEALQELTPNTLVVILDTHRPSMLPCPQLVQRAAKTVLIDHHRRSTDFINPCSLIYHEPYASSACEMATELLEYMNIGSSLTNKEAECLYTGILMDTKNFLVKTGVRTFDAASYLRRLGLNTIDIKKLFNVSKADYDHRADIVKTSKVIAPHIAVAHCYGKIPNIRVVASQAADEMLNIGDTYASIVVYPLEGSVGISARSLGDVNVQLIMEKLGGGGHSTVAGAQIKDKNVDMVVDDVINAVSEYLSNNGN